MKTKQLAFYVLLTQGIGTVFYGIFLAAYYLELPSNASLIGDSTFRTSLSIFGGLFLILIIGSLVASVIVKQED